MRIARFLLFIAIVSAAAASQGPEFTLKLDVPLVSLDIQVADSLTGHIVTDLTMDDFEVYEDGKRQEIRNFSAADTPYNILAMFDCTGSIRNQWRFLNDAMSHFVRNLRPQDRISIVAFGAGNKTLRDWTPRNSLQMDFEIPMNDSVCSDTDFYRSMSWAAEKVRGIDGRKGVLVFSDGVHEHIPRKNITIGGQGTTRFIDAAEDKDFQNSLRNVRASGAVFYFVAVNTDLNPAPVSDLLHPATDYTPISVYNMQQVRLRMELLASDTGGRIVFPKASSDYAELFERIGIELGTSYSLGYAPPDPSDPLRHLIEVRVNDKRLKVRQSRDSYRIQ